MFFNCYLGCGKAHLTSINPVSCLARPAYHLVPAVGCPFVSRALTNLPLLEALLQVPRRSLDDQWFWSFGPDPCPTPANMNQGPQIQPFDEFPIKTLPCPTSKSSSYCHLVNPSLSLLIHVLFSHLLISPCLSFCSCITLPHWILPSDRLISRLHALIIALTNFTRYRLALERNQPPPQIREAGEPTCALAESHPNTNRI